MSNDANDGDNMEPSPRLVTTVRFSHKRKSREILSRKSMTEEERHMLWYTPAELKGHFEREARLLMRGSSLSPSCRRQRLLLNMQEMD
jgi:hypothetical protein